MLGYHVHEKAILTVLIPMALYATDSRQAARHYLLLATFGTCALFPLLYGMQEYPIKVSAAMRMLSRPALCPVPFLGWPSDGRAKLCLTLAQEVVIS